METFRIRAKVWIYEGEPSASSNAAAMKGAWHFVTVPKKHSAFIKRLVGARATGWGSVPVNVSLGSARWKTSIFPDSKAGAYLLPLKAEVRKKENITAGDVVSLELRVLTPPDGRRRR